MSNLLTDEDYILMSFLEKNNKIKTGAEYRRLKACDGLLRVIAQVIPILQKKIDLCDKAEEFSRMKMNQADSWFNKVLEAYSKNDVNSKRVESLKANVKNISYRENTYRQRYENLKKDNLKLVDLLSDKKISNDELKQTLAEIMKRRCYE